ncbi:hypothetical protein SRHO_G00280760 [Serrasalmus rhombeus]
MKPGANIDLRWGSPIIRRVPPEVKSLSVGVGLWHLPKPAHTFEFIYSLSLRASRGGQSAQENLITSHRRVIRPCQNLPGAISRSSRLQQAGTVKAEVNYSERSVWRS